MRGNLIICSHFQFFEDSKLSKLNKKIENYDVWIYSNWPVIPMQEYFQPHIGPHQFHCDLIL